MAGRIELQGLLESILGTRHVYFQPPETVKLSYPCIIYELSNINSDYADGTKYKKSTSYSVTLIHNNPDNELVNKLLELNYCSFDNVFTADNLYHYVFTLFF